MSTAFHPETDGSMERANRRLSRHSVPTSTEPRQIGKITFAHVELTMNNSVNATTRKSLINLLYGTSVRLFPALETMTTTMVPEVAEFIRCINESQAIAKDGHLIAKTVQTRHANKKRRKQPHCKEGDYVLLDSENIRKRIKKDGRAYQLMAWTIQDYQGMAKYIDIQTKTHTSGRLRAHSPCIPYQHAEARMTQNNFL
jgi:hypothetical protein